MNNPRAFVNKFRYTILAVLIVVTIGYGYYLYRLYVPVTPGATAPAVDVVVMVDGTVRINGTLYDSPEKLRPKIAQIQTEHPDVGFNIKAAFGDHFEPTAKAVALLQRSGAKTIWVINDNKVGRVP